MFKIIKMILFLVIKLLNAQVSYEEAHALNKISYPHLKKLSKIDFISKIKINIFSKCPIVTKDDENCDNNSCSVPKIKFKNVDGFIDLLSVVESYSNSITNGRMVWESFSSISNDEFYQKVLSGLRFSVFTHICAFHTKILGIFFSNPYKYQSRIENNKYRENFINLWLFVRAAVGNLNFTSSVLNDNMKLISSLCYSKEIKDLADSIDLNNVIPKLNECIDFAACLDCEKCKLWSTIQLRGLRASIKALRGEMIKGNDLVYIFNLYMRLSETMVQNKILVGARFKPLYLIFVHYRAFLVLITIFLCLVLIFIKKWYVILFNNRRSVLFQLKNTVKHK